MRRHLCSAWCQRASAIIAAKQLSILHKNSVFPPSPMHTTWRELSQSSSNSSLLSSTLDSISKFASNTLKSCGVLPEKKCNVINTTKVQNVELKTSVTSPSRLERQDEEGQEKKQETAENMEQAIKKPVLSPEDLELIVNALREQYKDKDVTFTVNSKVGDDKGNNTDTNVNVSDDSYISERKESIMGGPGIGTKHGDMLAAFTCGRCDYRTVKKFSKHAYTKGIVIVECPNCHVKHLLADHLGWLEDKPWTIEDMLREKNEKFVHLGEGCFEV